MHYRVRLVGGSKHNQFHECDDLSLTISFPVRVESPYVSQSPGGLGIQSEYRDDVYVLREIPCASQRGGVFYEHIA
ncbi:MAG: hypothetical protein V3S55_09600 [Nitrospiraceae bacterium]